MTRNHWATFTAFPIPTEDRPVETLNDDLTTTTEHHSVRAYLAHRRKRSPAFQFKSIRGHGWVEIKWRLKDEHQHRISREDSQ